MYVPVPDLNCLTKIPVSSLLGHRATKYHLDVPFVGGVFH